jgi:hypothetical protein
VSDESLIVSIDDHRPEGSITEAVGSGGTTAEAACNCLEASTSRRLLASGNTTMKQKIVVHEGFSPSRGPHNDATSRQASQLDSAP